MYNLLVYGSRGGGGGLSSIHADNQSTESTERRAYHSITCNLIRVWVRVLGLGFRLLYMFCATFFITSPLWLAVGPKSL